MINFKINYKIKIIFIVFLLTFVFSCAYGPQQEKKSTLNYLNGEHYQSRANALIPIQIGNFISPVPVPFVVERIEKNTVIKGVAFLRQVDQFGNYDLPIRFQKIILLKENITICETTSNNEGFFSFSAPLNNGIYTIKLSNDKFNIEKNINVNSYSLEKVELIANKRPFQK
ncbi:MAG: hypothetical protein HQK51_01505 [Oligoflexia bacterium]|nr:hypothetical protein [Oligoflexia bacterium]